jgi:hypothetical protein
MKFGSAVIPAGNNDAIADGISRSIFAALVFTAFSKIL